MNRALIVLCAFLAASVAAGAQSPRSGNHPATVLRVTTQMVQVNVIVMGHAGQPVSGLTRKDFRLFDNGKAQTIAVFQEVVNRPSTVSSKPLPLDTFSNLRERSKDVAPSVTVILLDALNTPATDQAYAREQVIKFLGRLHPSDKDQVAIYVLGERLKVLHDFTADITPLLQTVRQYPGQIVSQLNAMANLPRLPTGASRGSADRWAREFNQMENHSEQLELDSYHRQRMKMTSEALIAIANHLAGFPGRKNLVWISGGFPMSGSLNGRGYRTGRGLGGVGRKTNSQNIWVARTVKALNNVNLSIYPVKAGGLGNTALLQRSVENGSFESRIASGEPAAVVDDSFDTMKAFARRTGGHAIYDTNDIAGSIRQVIDDSKVTYILAYYPQGVKWNGEYRKIKVRIDRPGMHLRYRHGYIAIPEKARPAANVDAALETVLVSPIDATGLGFTVRMFPNGGAQSARKGPFFVHYLVDMHDLTFKRRKRYWDARLTLVSDELGPHGRNLKSVSLTIRLHLKSRTYKRFLATGLGFRQRVPFPILPNAAQLRFVIRDDATGTIGSLSVPLDRVMHSRG